MQDDAYVFCKRLDSRARLMEIHLEEEMDYLRVIIDREGGDGDYLFWLGGTDRGLEGSWIWENSRVAVSEFVWIDNEPNNGIDGNCLYWRYDFNGGADAPCTHATSRYPLCQIPF